MFLLASALLRGTHFLQRISFGPGGHGEPMTGKVQYPSASFQFPLPQKFYDERTYLIQRLIAADVGPAAELFNLVNSDRMVEAHMIPDDDDDDEE